jgi:hypothetical protein
MENHEILDETNEMIMARLKAENKMWKGIAFLMTFCFIIVSFIFVALK